MNLGWQAWAAVGAGGALGAMARHGVSMLSMRLLGPAFPWGALAINVAGAFAIGYFVAAMAGRGEPAPLLKSFIATGLLGGLTTFSTFALEAATLFRDRSAGAAAIYVAASVALALVAVVAGLATGRGAS
jgi:CrcB protein